MTDDKKKECSNFAELFEKKEIGLLSSQEQVLMDKHAGGCRSCSNWVSQHNQLNELAAAMPQFDVSEGLTQKILESVNVQATPGVETSIMPIACVASVLFLMMIPFDSVQSLFGWGAGLIGLLAFQALMQTANSQEQQALYK